MTDNPLNYPERPRVLDLILSRALETAGAVAHLDPMKLVDLQQHILSDELFQQAAEEFQADREDQYDWLFKEEDSRGPFFVGLGVGVDDPEMIDLRKTHPAASMAEQTIVVPATSANSALLLEAIRRIDQLPNEWFSMDSAPKDGTPIYGIDETMKNDETQNCVEVIRWQKEGYWAHSNGEYSFEPTRWQPIRYPTHNADGTLASLPALKRLDDGTLGQPSPLPATRDLVWTIIHEIPPHRRAEFVKNVLIRIHKDCMLNQPDMDVLMSRLSEDSLCAEGVKAFKCWLAEQPAPSFITPYSVDQAQRDDDSRKDR